MPLFRDVPFRLDRLELAVGLAFITAGMLLVLYGVIEILSSSCSAPAPGTAFDGCWNGDAGYFVILGAILSVIGLFWSITGRVRGSRNQLGTRASPDHEG